jgi:hypothetical protein
LSCHWSKFAVRCIVHLRSLFGAVRCRIASVLNQNMGFPSIGRFSADQHQMRRRIFGSVPDRPNCFQILALLLQSRFLLFDSFRCAGSVLRTLRQCCTNPDRLPSMFEDALRVSFQPSSWKCFDSRIWLILSVHFHVCCWFMNCSPFVRHRQWCSVFWLRSAKT